MKTSRYHYKALDPLTEAQRVELAAQLRDPKSTVDSIYAWYVAQGYTLGRSTVGRLVQRSKLPTSTIPQSEAEQIAALLPSLTPHQLQIIAQIVREFTSR